MCNVLISRMPKYEYQKYRQYLISKENFWLPPQVEVDLQLSLDKVQTHLNLMHNVLSIHIILHLRRVIRVLPICIICRYMNF